ncbi:MAG: hypothetical protein PHT44_00990 [Candidatus Portnoybacteria bacterium]|nr:hypothetical protein [Candidatus Portnoybacteria bacterium]MDD4982813.1 hypothetical protein [Candidatus Portnoybacteria bacterium]
MKKARRAVVMMFIAIAVIVFVGIAGAATVEVGSNGGLRASRPPEQWKQTRVVIADDVLAYGDAWKQAYAKPGVVVPVKPEEVRFAREGLFHIKNTPVVVVGIIYDAQGIHLVRGVEGEPKIKFSPYLVLWVLSVVLMGMSVFFRKFNAAAAIAAPATAATAFAFAAIAAAAPATAATAFAFAAFAFAAFAAAVEWSKKVFKVFSSVYFLLMVASLIAFLMS